MTVTILFMVVRAMTLLMAEQKLMLFMVEMVMTFLRTTVIARFMEKVGTILLAQLQLNIQQNIKQEVELKV